MRKILLYLVHPAYERSRANRALVDAVRDLPHVTLHDLYEEYPDFLIDVEREQDLLRAHDVCVFQHPLFWYSSPALLKEWQDLVLQYGFAYGTEGRELAGKAWLTATTAGGDRAAYCAEGQNRFSVRTLLAPFEQTARLCLMRFLTPFVVFSSTKLDAGEPCRAIASVYRELLKRLGDESAPLESFERNDVLDAREVAEERAR